MLRFMLKWMVFILLSLTSLFSSAAYTTVRNNVSLYSNYLPNASSKFKGTVIFFNGSGNSALEWQINTHFFSCIKQRYSLFFYDRSSLGASPPNLNLSVANPNTAKLINDQLVQLLKKQHIPGPYLLVAHSYGGLYGGYFALKNPKLVRGVLLVDPAPRDFQYSSAIINEFAKAVIDARKNDAIYMIKHYSGPHVESAYILLGFHTSKLQLKKYGSISNTIPVIIMSSTAMEYYEKPIAGDWYDSQKQWLNKNKNSAIFQVKSGHFIQVDHPNFVCKQLNNLARDVN